MQLFIASTLASEAEHVCLTLGFLSGNIHCSTVSEDGTSCVLGGLSPCLICAIGKDDFICLATAHNSVQDLCEPFPTYLQPASAV